MSLASHAVNRLRGLYRSVLLRMRAHEISMAHPALGRGFTRLESLEPRLLLSSATLDTDGLLTVLGDESGTTVVLEQTAQQTDSATVAVGLDGAEAETFSGVKAILVQTGEGDDSVQLVSALTVATQIDGGEGVDSVVGPEAAFSWLLSGPGSGSVAGVSFSQVEEVVGGSGDDTFLLTGAFNGLIDGAGGRDTLSYASRSGSVTVDLAARTATDTTGVVGIEDIIGGSGADTLTGDSGANRLTGGPGADVLAGGPGDDVYVMTIGSLADTIAENSDEGSDWLGYSRFETAVTVDLGSAPATGVSSSVKAYSLSFRPCLIAR